ncbi:acyl-coenzyme A oxidase [Rhizopus stolonifer]|uniref:Acyl-coenzyme A oxidase n=1 Tax=Rhizopus stolonifer TaxID=4846 RepID=A0A367K6P5_RHIST|nr:acyl-coenzyme A oxidase [Rhizopus stolonifer]
MKYQLSLHYSAFMAVIKAQGTQEQVEKWYTASERHAIIGCYAQTELRSLLSIVLILQQAAKWWIGGLGVASTHAVVQAQLMIAGKSYGPHLFIVPIRSPLDLKPCKGVQIGDIGPKAYGGFSTVDNGFALFDHVRIPRENMLMKFAKVTPEGRYVPPVHNKLSYGSMVKLRVDIVGDAGWTLAKAVTIAIRYCTVRRQFNINKHDGLETQVISYSSVQHRLMPLLATAYGLIITGKSLYNQFTQLLEQLETNDTTLLPEIHVTSCALKSWGTRCSTDGMEECRKSMGGHGYSVFSGISGLFATSVPSNTYEGDNYVLSQQVARFLLKQLQLVAKGKPVTGSTAEYLMLLNQHMTVEHILDPQVQLGLFGLRAARLVADLAQQLQSGRAWSDLNMECWAVNLAHAEYLILKELIGQLKALTSTQYAPLYPIMKSISDMVIMGTFLSTSTILPSDLGKLNEAYRACMATISINAIALVDSFGFTDTELGSALGRYDGRAYEALWEATQKNPVNHGPDHIKLNNVVLEILHRGNNLEYLQSAKL